MKEPIPSVESFLEQMLPSWNGQMYRDEILELISLVGIRPFEGVCWCFKQFFFCILSAWYSPYNIYIYISPGGQYFIVPCHA